MCFQLEVSGYGPKRQEVHYLERKTGVTVRIRRSVLAADGPGAGRAPWLGRSSPRGAVLKSHFYGLRRLVCLTQDCLSVESGGRHWPPRGEPQRPGEWLGSLGAFLPAFGAARICRPLDVKGVANAHARGAAPGVGRGRPHPPRGGEPEAVVRLGRGGSRLANMGPR